MQYYIHMGIDKTNTIDSKAEELPKFYNGDNYVIEESIGYLIKQAQLALHRSIDDKMSDFDLTAMQWAPLMLLFYNKAKTAAELSRLLAVETSTTTRMLDRLETKGLVERKRCEKDRRLIYIALTDEGKQLAVRIPHIIAATFNHHLRGFSLEELNTLKSLLRRVAANGAA